MSYLPPYSHSKNKIEVELDFFNYATKSALKNATGILQFAKKDNLANLKSEVDKLDIDKLTELDADKLKPVPVDFKKLSDVADKKLVKKDLYDELV